MRKEQRWERMIRFLKAELKVVQIRAVESSSSSASCEKKDNRDNSSGRSSGGAHLTGGDEQIPAAAANADSAAAAGVLVATDGKCDLCGEKHHVPGINFVLCKRFLQMGIKKRKDLVMRKKRCLQCLDGQTGWRETDHKWKCTNRWVCRNEFHDTFDKKLHFLLCEQHADDPQNKQLYEEFKKDVLVTEWQKKLASSIYVCRALSVSSKEKTVANESNNIPSVEEEAIVLDMAQSEGNDEYPDATDSGTPTYILQPVPFNNKIFNLLFDTAAVKFVVRESAVDALPIVW